MKTLLATGAALGLVVAAAPAAAQSTPQDETVATTSSEMSAEQQAAYDGWPADRRTNYDAWPAEAQSYFWTLNPDQVRGWWLLTDEQRGQIVGMAPQQRAAAWTAIMNQINGGTATAAAPAATPATATAGTSNTATAARSQTSGTTAAQPATTGSGNIQFRSSERVQPTPGDQGPPSGEVPVCSANEQDNCINAWEAGKRGPGVNRPLDSWPGRPASEM